MWRRPSARRCRCWNPARPPARWPRRSSAARDGVGDVLAFDMGGTTAKLSLVDDGEPLVAYGFEAARQKRFIEGSGLPIRISTIELIEIGAGGGTIAHRDEIGLLKVGPDSAGSEPGPACYGRGGTEPTVTDADLLLGYLNPDFFAGGTMQIDWRAAADAMASLRRRSVCRPRPPCRHPRRRQREHGGRGARAHRRARPRPAPLRAALHRRRRAGARLQCRAQARHQAADLPAVAGGRLGARPAGGAGARRPRGDGRHPPRQGQLAALEAAFRRLEDEARAVMADTGLQLDGARIDRLADGRSSARASTSSYRCRPAPTTTMPSPPPAGRRLRARLPREVRPHPARRPGGVHQYAVSVRAPCPAGKIAELLAPPARRAAGRQGHAPA